jgi:hypothetical protein
MLIIASDRFGPELLDWDPETISMELAAEYGEVPQGNYNQLMAAIELVTSDTFYVSLPDFIRLCNTLYNGTFNPAEFDPADAGEVSWGITEAMLIWPPERDNENPFAEDILGYIRHAVREEGIMVPPDILRLGIQKGDNLWNNVQATFSDDPVMFNAIYDVERSKTDEINEMVKSRLSILLNQLDALDLEHGDGASAVKQMLVALKKESTRGSEMQPTQAGS